MKGAMIECIICKELSKDKILFGKHLGEERHKKAVEIVKRKALEKKKEREEKEAQEQQQEQNGDYGDNDIEVEQRNIEPINQQKRKADIDVEAILQQAKMQEAIENGEISSEQANFKQNLQQEEDDQDNEMMKEYKEQLKKQQEQEKEEMKKLQQEIDEEANQLKQQYVALLEEEAKKVVQYVEDKEYEEYRNAMDKEEEEEITEAKSLVASLRNKLKQKKNNLK